MAIDGLIILDNTGRPIIQSGFRSSTPAYPLLHIDAYTDAQQKAARPDDVDPVLYVPSYNSETGPSACCHIACGDMRFLCPVSGDVDPLFAFGFLRTFVDILREYFGTVSAATLKDNFDVVYQLLEETLDAGGHPLTTFPNALRDIVLPPSLLNKILSAAGANINPASSSSHSGFGNGAFSSPIPWRRSGVRHSSNEIYFDIQEELKAIVNRNGSPLSSNVWGQVETNCKLSGTPDCLLTFVNSELLADCTFHPCVRLQKWARDRVLSFVPPDGRFILFDYRYAPRSNAAVVGSNNLIPFVIKGSIGSEQSTGTFDISLTSRTSQTFENLVGEIYLGQGAGGIKCVASRGTGGFSSSSANPGSGAVSSWTFDTKRMVLKWEIPSVSASTTWVLRGSFTSSTSAPRPSRSIRIRFDVTAHTYSSLKVDQLRVSSVGESYKPYKGVRGRSKCDVEWRL